MLLAYIDEIGEPGAFVSRDDPRYNTSPAFGYAGFIIPEDHARAFGAEFTKRKRELFRTELEASPDPDRWERKGAEMFRKSTPEQFPQYLRVFGGLVGFLKRRRGNLLYYADEKPCGTPRQTSLDVTDRETLAMRETLNRIARHAHKHDQNVLVLIDQINEKNRAERLPRMYAHIFGRASEYPEMRRIVEPPMHIDSQLSSNIQFADWIAAVLTRAIDYQLIQDSAYRWVTQASAFDSLKGAFTSNSKLHLIQRDVEDIHHTLILNPTRALFPHPVGHMVTERLDPNVAKKLRRMYEAERSKPTS